MTHASVLQENGQLKHPIEKICCNSTSMHLRHKHEPDIQFLHQVHSLLGNLVLLDVGESPHLVSPWSQETLWWWMTDRMACGSWSDTPENTKKPSYKYNFSVEPESQFYRRQKRAFLKIMSCCLRHKSDLSPTALITRASILLQLNRALLCEKLWVNVWVIW